MNYLIGGGVGGKKRMGPMLTTKKNLVKQTNEQKPRRDKTKDGIQTNKQNNSVKEY